MNREKAVQWLSDNQRGWPSYYEFSIKNIESPNGWNWTPVDFAIILISENKQDVIGFGDFLRVVLKNHLGCGDDVFRRENE